MRYDTPPRTNILFLSINDANPSFKADVSIGITPCRFLDPHSPFWTIALLTCALFPLTVVILPLLYAFFLSSLLPRSSLFTPHYIFFAIPHTHTSLCLPPFSVFHPSREVELNQLCILSFFLPYPSFYFCLLSLSISISTVPDVTYTYHALDLLFFVFFVLFVLFFSFFSFHYHPRLYILYSFTRSNIHFFQWSCGLTSLHTSLARGSSTRKERLAHAGRCVCRTRVCRRCVYVLFIVLDVVKSW